MFLSEKNSGHLVEVLDVAQLFDPFSKTFTGRLNYGEDLPEPQDFNKADVAFQSGEPLPKCWVDPHYRDDELKRS
ncbi:MAG: hypothetical protein ACWA44_14675 [Thiotrichales bacterium]